MSDTLLICTFWGSVATIAYAYAGFPLLVGLRGLRSTPKPRGHGPLPSVSYLIVAHNECGVIEEKLSNTDALDYPRELLEVIVASDGSDDGTNQRVSAHRSPGLRLLALPRLGKNAALNAAVAEAKGEILVFSDADSMLARDALRRLVEPFADASIGGVGGNFHYASEAAEGEGERAYWSLDRVWKHLESRAGNMTSATGQIYAIRRDLFRPVPDGVTDDFFVSTGVIVAHRRLWFASGAVAVGPVAETADIELQRKLRVMGRGFASVWSRRQLLDPRRHGFYAVQLFSHKVLRRLVGIPLLGLALVAPLLSALHPFYLAAALGQAIFHAAAAAGWLLRRRPAGRVRWLSIPLYFDLVNLAGVVAFANFVRGKRHLGWVPQRGRPALGPPGPVPVEER